MRALRSGSLILAACFASRWALAAPSAPELATPSAAPEPAQPSPGPAPPPPAPPSPEPAPPPPAPEPPSSLPIDSPAIAPVPPPAGQTEAPPNDQRSTLPLLASPRLVPVVEPSVRPFARDYAALPLTLEARFGFNARLGSNFDSSADDETVDTSFGIGAYLAWRPEYAVGLELEHSGLGRVRALSAENSIDAEYSVTTAWLATRVFPWRSGRVDLFLNLRLGLAEQHVDALGTRQESGSIAVPAVSYSCSEWDGPGIALGAGVGLGYRVVRGVSVVSRIDAAGERLSGGELGTCAAGIGSVTSIAGTLGISYEFDTAKR